MGARVITSKIDVLWRWLLPIQYLLISAFIVVSAYSVWLTARPVAFYVVEAAIMLSSFALIRAGGGARARNAILLTMMILSTANSVIPLLENRLLLFGPDQSGDWLASVSITRDGNLLNAAAISGGYYSFIPSLATTIATTSLASGSTVVFSYMLVTAVVGLLLGLTIYSLVLRVSGSLLASVAGVFVLMSTPRLADVDMIPQVASLVLGAAALLLIVPTRRGRASLVLVPIISFAILTLHPEGMVVLLLLAGGLLAWWATGLANPSEHRPQVSGRLFLTIGVLAGTYWTLNGTVLLAVVGPLRSLYRTLMEAGLSRASTYSPQYYGSSAAFALAWALPVALSAGYVLVFLVRRFRKNQNTGDLDLASSIMAFSGLALTLLAFATVLANPGAAIERYLDSAGYLLMLVPSALVMGFFMSSRRRLVALAALAMLVTSVGVGLASPDWAPLENPEFGAVHFTYLGYQDAQPIARALSTGCFVYQDNDINVLALAYLRGVICSTPASFQVTRNTLSMIGAGQTPTGSEAPAGLTVYIISDARITGQVSNLTLNVVFDSELHVVLTST